MKKIETKVDRAVAWVLAALLATSALSAGVWAPSAQAAELTGAEIEKLISGNTLKGLLSAGLYAFAYYPDGTIVGTISQRPDHGKWTIEGNHYCHEWDNFLMGIKACYAWSSRGEGYFLRNVDALRTTDIQGKITSGHPRGY